MVIEYEVLLATYNGAKYIETQLISIFRQTNPPSRVLISDDNSSDGTVDIVLQCAARNSFNIEILAVNKNQRLGSCRNFERLLSATTSNYVMLADQDDVWDLNKAELLLEKMLQVENYNISKFPIIVHSDLRVINNQGSIISPSFFTYQHLNPSHNDWISIAIQNVVTGCSCLLNRSCIEAALPFPDTAIMHDWWLALIASRLGRVVYLDRPCISYRQHGHNVVGAKGYKLLALTSLIELLSGVNLFRRIDAPIKQLQSCFSRYPMNSEIIENSIRGLNHKYLHIRIISALRLKLRKHGILRTFVFYLSLCFWNPDQHSS